MFEKFLKLKNKKHSTKGFTLIELLVVVAIIGILSSVVLVSLNSAREKSKIALIKSTLKQLYSQAQINFTENGSFINSNPSNTDLTCTGPGNNLGKIVQPLIDQGIIVKCFSFNGTVWGSVFVGDNYNRFAATALIYDSGLLKAWSVDENGIVKWDTQGVKIDGTTISPDESMSWYSGQTACALNGGRLPTIEQSRTLFSGWYTASGNNSYYPVGFSGGYFYWTSVTFINNSSWSYLIYTTNSNPDYAAKTSTLYKVRCVR